MHEQTLGGGASTWATVAYEVMCRGAGEAALYGATLTRRCSLDLLVRWAEQRSQTVSTREPTFGFVIEVPPQEEAARTALYRRALGVARVLFEEASIALASGTRNCPGESNEQLVKQYADALEIERWLGVLTGEAADKP